MIASRLIAHKADLSVVDDRGHSLPMIAAINSQFMLMKLLIESGVDLEQTNHDGFTLPQLVNKCHNLTLGEAIAVSAFNHESEGVSALWPLLTHGYHFYFI